MPRSARPSPARPVTRLASTAAILLAVFPVTVLTLNLIQRHHYDPIRDAVSLLALGTGGAAMNAAFFLLGLGIGLMALVLRRSVRKGVAGPALLTIAAVAAFTSGIFHTNADGAPSTTESDIHMVAGITVFLSMVAAMFVFAWRFRRDPRWHRFARPTLIWALAGTVTFLLIPLAGDPRFGLAQRLHIATWLSWLLVASLRARHAKLSTQDPGQHPAHASPAQHPARRI
jgi:hypothetical membrane protein